MREAHELLLEPKVYNSSGGIDGYHVLRPASVVARIAPAMLLGVARRNRYHGVWCLMQLVVESASLLYVS